MTATNCNVSKKISSAIAKNTTCCVRLFLIILSPDQSKVNCILFYLKHYFLLVLLNGGPGKKGGYSQKINPYL